MRGARWPAPRLALRTQRQLRAGLRGGGRARAFLSLSQVAKPDTGGPTHSSHHAGQTGGRKARRAGKESEENKVNIICQQR